MKIEEISSSYIVDNISKTERTTIAKCLNGVLADEYALFTKTLNYHWSVTGPRFHSLHKMFEEQYRELLTVMDEIAERVRILEESPIATVRDFASAMEVNETPGERLNSRQMIADLFATHIHIQKSIESNLENINSLEKDFGTEDFLVGLLQKHQMMSWTLKSHLSE